MSVRKVYLGWLPKGVANAKALKTSYDIAIGSLPTKIVVTRPPNKLDYVDGEAIDLTGIIVNAYCEDESAFSVVPTKELIIDPTTADATKKEDEGYTYDLDTSPYVQPIRKNKQVIVRTEGTSWGTHLWYDYSTFIPNDDTFLFIVIPNNSGWSSISEISKSPNPSTTVKIYRDSTGETSTYVGPYSDWASPPDNSVHSYTVGGKTVYYRLAFPVYRLSREDMGHNSKLIEGEVLVDGGGSVGRTDIASAAWVAMYGNATGGGQPITVKWKRPIDNQVLETSFTINVN